MDDFVAAAFSKTHGGNVVSIGSPYSLLQVASPSPHATLCYWDEAFMRKLSGFDVLPPRKSFSAGSHRCRLVGERCCPVLDAGGKLYRMITLDRLLAGLRDCSLVEIRWSAAANRTLAAGMNGIEAHKPVVALTYVPREQLGELEEAETRLARYGYAPASARLDGAYASRLYHHDEGAPRDAAVSPHAVVARARRAHARRGFLSDEIRLDAGQICRSSGVFFEPSERLGSFWTRSPATPFLLFAPTAGTYEIQILIEDFAFDRDLGLGQIRHFGEVGGRTVLSTGADNRVVASLYVSDVEACDGCLFVFETPRCEDRSFSSGRRSVGAKIRGLTYRLVTTH